MSYQSLCPVLQEKAQFVKFVAGMAPEDLNSSDFDDSGSDSDEPSPPSGRGSSHAGPGGGRGSPFSFGAPSPSQRGDAKPPPAAGKAAPKPAGQPAALPAAAAAGSSAAPAASASAGGNAAQMGVRWLEAAKTGNVGEMEYLLGARPELLTFQGTGAWRRAHLIPSFRIASGAAAFFWCYNRRHALQKAATMRRSAYLGRSCPDSHAPSYVALDP